MKRRDVMKVGAVTAGAAAGMPGCAVPRMMAELSGVEGAQAFNAMIDQQTVRIGTPPDLLRHLLAGAVPELLQTPRTPEAAAELAEKDGLFRKMLSTLLVSQGFRDLPPETQLEPAVQERMWSHIDDIGETVFQVGDLLATLDSSKRGRVQQVLRDRPDLPMQISEAIEAQAVAVGLSPKRRVQLRKMMSQASFRLKNGDPLTMIDEYAAKVQRLKERTDTDAKALALAQQMGDKAFWRYQHLLQQQAGGAPPTMVAQSGPPGTTDPTAPGAMPPPGPATPPGPPKRKPGRKMVRAGGYMMGIGVIVFGVSVLLVDTSEAFLVGGTLGALLIAIGFLVLIIGAIIAATSS